MKILLSNYFKINNNSIVLLDRAFLGLYAILKLLKKTSKRNQVLFTSNTCASPVFAAIYANLKPIFTDINLNDFLMDINDVKATLKKNDNILAIVYINTFGHTSNDILEIKKLTESYGIYLIEDLAQAFGVKVDDKKGGLIGDFSVLSFGATKQIDAGSGGALILNSNLFNNQEVEKELTNIERYKVDVSLETHYKEHFYSDRQLSIYNNTYYDNFKNYYSVYKKLYFKEINVDWDVVKSKFKDFINNDEMKKRNEKAFLYENKFKNKGFNFTLPKINDSCSIYRYTFLTKEVKEAQDLSDYLRKNDIHCSNLYLPVSGFFNDTFKNSIYFSSRVINLWVADFVDENYINNTVNVIDKFYMEKK